MASGDSFTGILGIPNQDIAIWESVGAITDRMQERLGASDKTAAENDLIAIIATRANNPRA